MHVYNPEKVQSKSAQKMVQAFSNQIYFPGLPSDFKVSSIAFFRRRPRGFTSGHALMTNPAGARRGGRPILIGYVCTFALMFGMTTVHQIKANKWFQ